MAYIGFVVFINQLPCLPLARIWRFAPAGERRGWGEDDVVSESGNGSIKLQIADCRSLLLIYDMFGRQQDEIQIPKGQKEVQIDVSGYPIGIYIAILQSEREIMDRKKFVVSR